MHRTRYEERIKQLGRELSEARERLAEANREGSMRGAAADTAVRNLRATLAQLRTEKGRLETRLEDALSKAAARGGSLSEEVRELRARERRALDAGRRFKKAYDFQRALLARKAEQFVLARARAKHLATLIRRHRVPLSPASARLLSGDALEEEMLAGMEHLDFEQQDDCGLHDDDCGVQGDDGGVHDDDGGLHDDDGGVHEDECRDAARPVVPSKRPTHPAPGEARQDVVCDDDRGAAVGPPSDAPSAVPGCVGMPRGTDIPRSILRMSPLIRRRSDVFARLADSASLNLACVSSGVEPPPHCLPAGDLLSRGCAAPAAFGPAGERADDPHAMDVDY